MTVFLFELASRLTSASNVEFDFSNGMQSELSKMFDGTCCSNETPHSIESLLDYDIRYLSTEIQPIFNSCCLLLRRNHARKRCLEKCLSSIMTLRCSSLIEAQDQILAIDKLESKIPITQERLREISNYMQVMIELGHSDSNFFQRTGRTGPYSWEIAYNQLVKHGRAIREKESARMRAMITSTKESLANIQLLIKLSAEQDPTLKDDLIMRQKELMETLNLLEGL